MPHPAPGIELDALIALRHDFKDVVLYARLFAIARAGPQVFGSSASNSIDRSSTG
jgi:hypothetical protein